MIKSFDVFDYPIAYAIPARVSEQSFWVEHVPFGIVLLQLASPRVLVELGTQFNSGLVLPHGKYDVSKGLGVNAMPLVPAA